MIQKILFECNKRENNYKVIHLILHKNDIKSHTNREERFQSKLMLHLLIQWFNYYDKPTKKEFLLQRKQQGLIVNKNIAKVTNHLKECFPRQFS